MRYVDANLLFLDLSYLSSISCVSGCQRSASSGPVRVVCLKNVVFIGFAGNCVIAGMKDAVYGA
jgi:hypothetical protein